MDNLTHTFTAVACTHAMSRERPTRLTLGAAVVAANVQDVDWLPSFFSLPAGLEAHRGPTHSLLAVPVLALAVAAGFRLSMRRRESAERAEFFPLLWICLVAAASHLLLDLSTPYGVRLFLPFDRTWVYGDLVGIFDPWMWLVLGGTALLLSSRDATPTWTVLGSVIVVGSLRMIPMKGTFGAVAGVVWIAAAAGVVIAWLRGVDPVARRTVAGAGLALTLLYVGCLALLHQRALTRARAVVASGVAGQGERPGRVAAIPTVGDLSTWRGIAEGERSVYRFAIPIGAPSPETVERFRSLGDPVVGPLVRADPTPLARAFLAFARFAVVDVGMEDGRRVLLMADARYNEARSDEPRTWTVRDPLDP
jgi:membrane-bound metal-dependent hydrolase YbcI (DUF457 family)